MMRKPQQKFRLHSPRGGVFQKQKCKENGVLIHKNINQSKEK